jgi:hypothetical protein
VLGSAPSMLFLKETIIELCLCCKCGFCACKIGCNHVVNFPVEEMVQNPCEGCYEHSWNN